MVLACFLEPELLCSWILLKKYNCKSNADTKNNCNPHRESSRQHMSDTCCQAHWSFSNRRITGENKKQIVTWINIKYKFKTLSLGTSLTKYTGVDGWQYKLD